MSRFNPEKWCLHIGPGRLILGSQSGTQSWHMRTSVAYAESNTSSSDLPVSAFHNAAGKLVRKCKVQLVVADALVRYFIVTPPDNVAQLSALQKIAQLRFSGLYGQPASEWELCADWSASGPFLVCGIRRKLIDAATRLLEQTGAQCAGLVPESVALWNQQRAEIADNHAWLLNVQEGSVCVAALHHGRITGISSHHDLPHDLNTVQIILQREALRWNRTLPKTLYVNAGSLGMLDGQVAGITRISMLPAHSSQGLHALFTHAAAQHQPATLALPESVA